MPMMWLLRFVGTISVYIIAPPLALSVIVIFVGFCLYFCSIAALLMVSAAIVGYFPDISRSTTPTFRIICIGACPRF